MTLTEQVDELRRGRIDPDESRRAQARYAELRLAVALELLWLHVNEPTAIARWADDGGPA